MKKIIICLLFMFAFSSLVHAEEAGNGAFFQLSFYHPLEFPYNVSSVSGLRICPLFGDTPQVHGLDIGVIQFATSEMFGVEAGMWNRTGDTRGIQLAFGLNYSSDLTGAQMSGLLNKALTVKGFQASVSNVAQDVTGAQISIFTNFTKSITGFQGISCYNVCSNGSCWQIGAVNQAENISGFQLGALANITTAFNGLQIGIFNYSENLSGYQIGLINKSKTRLMPFYNWSD